MTISVGLFGFGRTGSAVANEIILDREYELKWVFRKSIANEGEYASRLLGHERNEGRIFSLVNTNVERFYEENRVDVIIDFSASCAVEEYKNAADYGTRIVSAISNYDTEDFTQLKKLGLKTAVLYSPQHYIGD